MPIFTSKMSLKCHKKPISVLKMYIRGFYEKTSIFALENNFSENIYEKYAIFAYFHEKLGFPTVNLKKRVYPFFQFTVQTLHF